jgi:ABC-2 type transport system permease protein
MNKFWHLLTISFKTDFKLININSKKNFFLNKIILPIIIIIFVFYCVGFYAYELANVLFPLHMTYILLSIWLILLFVFIAFETVYKAQNYLFECKDNDLLLALPISKSYLLLTRVIKLFVFEALFGCLFLLPAMGIYIYFEHPSLNFYFIALLMLISEAIIPTVIGSFIAYLIKSFSVHFKSKKVIQIILSLLFTLMIFYISFNPDIINNNLAVNAFNINQIISKIYYPITLLQNMLNHFQLLDLFKYLGLNILIIILFIYLIGINYFKIMQKSNDNVVNHKNKIYKFRYNGPFKAIIIKEIKRFFSSPTYVLNTLFGVLLILILTICLLVKPDFVFNTILKNSADLTITDIVNNIPKFYLAMLVFSLALCSITSSSISLEGKYFNFLKSLPITTKNVLLAKICSSLIIIYPLVFLTNILFFKYLNNDYLEFLIINLVSIILPIFIELLGMLINLKYPKLEFKNDTEVVKQSMSTLISVYAGMAVAGFLIILTLVLNDYINFYLLQFLMLLILFIMSIFLYYLLISKGVKLFNKINN